MLLPFRYFFILWIDTCDLSPLFFFFITKKFFDRFLLIFKFFLFSISFSHFSPDNFVNFDEYDKVYCISFQTGASCTNQNICSISFSIFFIDKIASKEKFTKTFNYRLVPISGMLVLIQAVSNLIETCAI